MTTAIKTGMNLGEMVFVFKNEENKMMQEFPQLEVIGNSRRGKEHTYYLSPFRAYGFQVSGGPNGQGSYGESGFVGLKNLLVLGENIAKAQFYGMALNALHDHSRIVGENWHPSFEEKQKIDKFATASYEWVKSLTQQPVKKESVLERITKQFDKNFKKIK